VPRVDVVVVGAGAMGSATAWHLVRRGRAVALLERFEPGHVRGSSHGGSRIFRLAYDDPQYVHLARAALAGWRELEDDAGEDLLDLTGGVDHGEAAAVERVAAALTGSGAAFEVLSPQRAAERWPGMRFEGQVVVSPEGGRCRSDATVAALQRRVAELGGDVRFETPVEAVVPAGDGVEVRTAGDTWQATTAVVAAGSWLPQLAGDVPGLPPLEVTQEQVVHFPIAPGAPGLETWPSFVHRGSWIYGLATPGEGVKVAEHHTGPVVDPDERSFDPDPAGVDRVRRYAGEWLPGLVPEPASVTTCLYTTTPTEDFVLDRVGPVVVASPCSGHGFKFTPEIGRLVAGLAMGAPPEVPRFTLPAHAAAARPSGHR
jgi:sarcosine oxidase